jgi:hypothetical protein
MGCEEKLIGALGRLPLNRPGMADVKGTKRLESQWGGGVKDCQISDRGARTGVLVGVEHRICILRDLICNWLYDFINLQLFVP